LANSQNKRKYNSASNDLLALFFMRLYAAFVDFVRFATTRFCQKYYDVKLTVCRERIDVILSTREGTAPLHLRYRRTARTELPVTGQASCCTCLWTSSFQVVESWFTARFVRVFLTAIPFT
jgi:hypothetical protein